VDRPERLTFILELICLFVGTGGGIVDLVCELFCVCEDCAGDSKCGLKFMMCVCWAGDWTSMLENVFV